MGKRLAPYICGGLCSVQLFLSRCRGLMGHLSVGCSSTCSLQPEAFPQGFILVVWLRAAMVVCFVLWWSVVILQIGGARLVIHTWTWLLVSVVVDLEVLARQLVKIASRDLRTNAIHAHPRHRPRTSFSAFLLTRFILQVVSNTLARASTSCRCERVQCPNDVLSSWMPNLESWFAASSMLLAYYARMTVVLRL